MEPFIGEIRIFPLDFAPMGWAWCNGQLLPIVQNTALFSLIGNMYGGDGKNNFALPNLQGRAVMNPGTGPGLTPHNVAESGGAETVTLLPAQMPAHNHTLGAQNVPLGAVTTAAGNTFDRPASGNLFNDANPVLVQMSDQAIDAVGSGGAHNNMQPYLTLNFNIALQGIYPVRP